MLFDSLDFRPSTSSLSVHLHLYILHFYLGRKQAFNSNGTITFVTDQLAADCNPAALFTKCLRRELRRPTSAWTKQGAQRKHVERSAAYTDRLYCILDVSYAESPGLRRALYSSTAFADIYSPS